MNKETKVEMMMMKFTGTDFKWLISCLSKSDCGSQSIVKKVNSGGDSCFNSRLSRLMSID